MITLLCHCEGETQNKSPIKCRSPVPEREGGQGEGFLSV